MEDGGGILKSKGKVIIANTGDDTLTFLDSKKGKIIDVLDLKSIKSNSPIGPYELINIGNNLLYCINIYDNSLYKINIDTKEILDAVYTGCYPSCIEYFKDNFYIVNTDSNSISVIDEKDFSLIESIPVGDKPTDIEIDKVNMKIYIANSNDCSISKIDLIRNESTTIKLKNNPLRIVLEENHMYILFNANSSPFYKSNISIMDLETLEIENIIDLKGIFNTMLKINNSEIIFTTNIGNGFLYRIDIKKGNLLSKANLLGIPNKLAWDGDETIYITNISNNTLTLFDIKTNSIIYNIKVGMEPNGILFFS